jgi:hypothetical protein
MKNLTVSIPDGAYHDARVWAAERGTSVSRIVTFFLKTLPERKAPAQRFPLIHQPDRPSS